VPKLCLSWPHSKQDKKIIRLQHLYPNYEIDVYLLFITKQQITKISNADNPVHLCMGECDVTITSTFELSWSLSLFYQQKFHLCLCLNLLNKLFNVKVAEFFTWQNTAQKAHQVAGYFNNNNGFFIAARMLDYTISATQDSAYNRTQIIIRT